MKKALIVVDYQVDFVSGSLGFPGAEKLEPVIVDLIEKADKEGIEVIFTRDIHEDDYLDSEEGKNLPVPHCIRGSGGERFFGRIEEMSKGHEVFEKPTFPGASLFDYLRKGDYGEISLCGLDTSICVLSNCVMAKAAKPNAHIRLLRFASGCGDPKSEQIAVDALKRIHVEIIENP